jgi:prepilin peptidase CpaA
MGTPPTVALVLLLGALPVCAWAAYVDLSRMKIPNRAVAALAMVFFVAGLLLLPLDSWSLGDWAWRWIHLVVVLLIGMALNAVYLIGAGDAKFAAAAAPFVALSDLGTLLWLYVASVLLCWLLHSIARHSFGPRLAPGWVSWTTGKRFPMGLALGVALVAYLAVAAAT